MRGAGDPTAPHALTGHIVLGFCFVAGLDHPFVVFVRLLRATFETPEEFAAVIARNDDKLQGIGHKTSERRCLELRDVPAKMDLGQASESRTWCCNRCRRATRSRRW